MGSFRSQPDLQKHTETGQGLGLTYVSSHMCGNFFVLFQAGEIIWKMHTSPSLLFPVERTRFSQSSTVTEVTIHLYSGAEVSKFVERHFIV